MQLRSLKINKYLCDFKKNRLRYFIKLAYNGTQYHGWQQQPNAASVQETINKAISTILNTETNVMGAGRTDTGVHAREMYAHFDFDDNIDVPTIVHKLNSYLPNDIVIHTIFQVTDEAHCRFDAVKRTYEYHINTFKDPFLQQQSYYFHQTLDISLMNEAAKLLFNYTDFECFSKVNTDVNTFNCSIYEAQWTLSAHKQVNDKSENGRLVFTISANRFLRNMVRAIVGTLINVGLHKITLNDFESIIKSKSRNRAGFSVPAHGLYLTEIAYNYITK